MWCVRKFNDLLLAQGVQSSSAEVIKTMRKLMILVAVAAMAVAPMTASAARLVVVGGPVFGAGFYGPYWGPYWGPAYGYPVLGEVKIDTKAKDGEVFINGAFAGTTKDARTMHLAPGTYNIEVRFAGAPAINEQVFVAAGKTIHLRPGV
jgi:hypothetical protein